MKIGDLAEQADCAVETIRYYERIGLIPPPQRNPDNNYRRYSQEHLDTLNFIRHCRALDMAQEEIRRLLEARQHPQQPCQEINQLLDHHLQHVQCRIAQLSELARQLQDIRSQCQGQGAVDSCGILQELTHPSQPLGTELEASHVGGCHKG